MARLGLITAIREDITIPVEAVMKRVASNLGPMYLASYLEKMGVPIEVIIKDRLEDLEPYAPEILGISSLTENIEHAKSLARVARQKWNPITVLGGAHLTALPKALPKEFDVGVVGEGEETICDLVRLFLRDRSLSPEDLKAIPGIVFHTPKGVWQTPIRKGIDPLDSIPPPDRRKYVKKIGLTHMMTSRGCPYTCDFCVIPNISEGYRKHSPAYVVEELKSIKSAFPHVRHIKIFDDLFVVDRRRVHEIANLVAAEGLNKEFSFGCWVRANLVDDAVLDSFQKMNMLYAAFGAESGSSRVLSQIKPGCSLEDNQRTIDRLYDRGILVECSVILGHPLETEADLWATYEFLEKNFDKIYDVEMNTAIPWPGSEFWERAKARGIVNENMDFNILKEYVQLVNYSTEEYPYLNEKIPSERFDKILISFKKLYWKWAKRNLASGEYKVMNTEEGIARHY
ncbi:MAG: radical SAM protein [bacterium]